MIAAVTVMPERKRPDVASEGASHCRRSEWQDNHQISPFLCILSRRVSFVVLLPVPCSHVLMVEAHRSICGASVQWER